MIKTPKESFFERIIRNLNFDFDLILIGVALFFIAYIYLYKDSKNNKVTSVKYGKKGKAKGIIFGKKGKKLAYSPVEDEGHIGVFSASGTGKTSAVGIPTLRSWTGTSFVIDISGDIEKNCPQVTSKLTYEPDNPSTLPYSVFATIDVNRSDLDKQNEQLAQLALQLMPREENRSDNSSYFIENGRKILISALVAFYHQGMDFIEICETVADLGYLELFSKIDQTRDTLAMRYITGFIGGNEKNISGCKQAVDEALTLFATNSNLKKTLRRPNPGEQSVKVEDIESSSIFIKIEDPKLELYSPLLGIITSQIMEYISNRKVEKSSKTILLFLDEYASLKIDKDTVLQALRKYRKRKCRLMILTQNMADLNLLYGEFATRAILANLKFKELLGGLGEPESQKYFADLIGYEDVEKRSISKSSRSISTTKSDQKEYKIAPADLDMQGKDTAILVLAEGKGYMKLKKNFYFKK